MLMNTYTYTHIPTLYYCLSFAKKCYVKEEDQQRKDYVSLCVYAQVMHRLLF